MNKPTKGLLLAGVFALGTLLFSLAPVVTSPAYHFEKETGGHYLGEIEPEIRGVYAEKFRTPTDNKYNTQKNYSMNIIGDIQSVWDNYTGQGVTVAIIDDGFDHDHPEFKRSDNSSALSQDSAYFYSSGSSYGVSYYKNNPSCIDEDWEGKEWATHGTSTSTTAAAPIDNGGVVGIAPEATILALKIDMSFVAIKAAIEYAVQKGADVINMSLGAYAESFTDPFGDSHSGSSSTASYLNTVCNTAYNNGVIVCASAGNEATYRKSYPACNSHVIGVGALEENDGNTLAAFTNYVGSSQTGEINVDILAPGYVYAAAIGGTSSSSHTHIYEDTAGTSFSSPIVAGAAALWKQANPSGTPDQFLSALQESAANKGYYANKYVPTSLYQGISNDVGPSNIQAGRLDVGALMALGTDVTGVEVTPASATIYTNASPNTVQLTAQVSPATALNKSVSWKSSNTAVATVSSTGSVTARSAGTATITATTAEGGFKSTSTITVRQYVYPTSISVANKNVEVEVGDSYVVNDVTFTPSNVTEPVFFLESADTSIATVSESSNSIIGVAPGTTTVAVQALTATDIIEDTITVTVIPASEVTATFDFYETSQITSESQKRTVWNEKDVAFAIDQNTGSSNTNAYTSDPLRIYTGFKVTISVPDGYSLKELSFVANSSSYGNALRNATWTGGTAGGSGASVIVTPEADAQSVSFVLSAQTRLNSLAVTYKAGTAVATVTGISLPESEKTLEKGESYLLSPTVTMSDGSAYSGLIDYVSSNTAVATVTSYGMVQAVDKGSATITASAGDHQATLALTVIWTNEPLLDSITLANAPQTVTFKGDFSTSGIVVTAHYTHGGADKTVTSSTTFSEINTDTIGYKEVTATYTEGDITKHASFIVFVTNVGATRSESTYPGGTVSGTVSTAAERYSADNQTKSIDGMDWTLHINEGVDAPYFGGTDANGSQIGSKNNGVSDFTLTSQSFSEPLTSVRITARSGGTTQLYVSVGGVPYTYGNREYASLTSSLAEYEFVGSSSGEVVVRYLSTATCANYFRGFAIAKQGGTVYSWTGEEQAASFVAYLKTFDGSCASGFESREEVARLVDEYNAMILESKQDEAMYEVFTDKGGIETNAVAKLVKMVEQYNTTLEQGESALSLDLPEGDNALLSAGFSKQNNASPLTLLLVVSVLGTAMFIVVIYMAKKHKED